MAILSRPQCVNQLRPRQNGRRFADDTFKRIFLNENVIISIKISLKSVPKGSINNNPALVQIMAWRRSGGKPLSEPMMVSLLTHICVTRPQWVNPSNAETGVFRGYSGCRCAGPCVARSRQEWYCIRRIHGPLSSTRNYLPSQYWEIANIHFIFLKKKNSPHLLGTLYI